MANPTVFYLSPAGVLLQQLSNLGVPLAGGLVYILVAGSVNTLATTYTDSTGTTANANPMVLNSAGRLAAANAPASIWVPGNTPHKMLLTDAAGNLLAGGVCMDNLYGINDPIGILNSLANPATGFGADLVANAVRSYDVVAAVRAANVPTLTGAETLVIDVEGGVLVNDGLGGIFYWSPTSTAVDDGTSVIKPNAIIAANPGRYLRQTNLFGISGNFNVVITGAVTTPNMNVTWVKNGPLVTVNFAGTAPLTSNSVAFGATGFLPALQGPTAQALSPLIPASDNSTPGVAAYCVVPNAGAGTALNFVINNASGNWTVGAVTKSLASFAFTYVAH
jgi:hypothetical protein